MASKQQTNDIPASGDYASPFVLAIDVGSSSVRATLFDAGAHAVEGVAAREAHMLYSAAEGTAEEIAEHVLERVNRVIDSVLQAAGPLASQIRAVGMDALASTLLGVDSEGQVFQSPAPSFDLILQRNDGSARRSTVCMLPMIP